MSDKVGVGSDKVGVGTVIDSPEVIEELLTGDKLSLAEAAKLLPSGRKGRPVNPSCLYRWATAGVAGPGGRVVKLEVARVGCRIATSMGAIRRFLTALNPPAPDSPQANPRKRGCKKQTASAPTECLAEELRRRGV